MEYQGEEQYRYQGWEGLPMVKLPRKYFTTGLAEVYEVFKRKESPEPDDYKVIKDFVDMCKIISDAMNIRDLSNKQTHPCNFFAVAPHDVAPFEVMDMCSRLVNKYPLAEDDKNFLAMFKIKLGEHFPKTSEWRNWSVVDTPKALRLLKTKRIVKFNGNEVTVDCSSDEGFAKLCKNVDDIIEKYNLPRYSYCVYMLGYELSRGREAIRLGKDDDCITYDNKTSVRMSPAKPTKPKELV